MSRDYPTPIALWLAAALAWSAVCAHAGLPIGDFANYYAPAALWWEGVDLARLYEYAWFQQAAAPWYGDHLVGFPVLTPPSALVMVPLVPLGVLGAMKVWWLLQWVAGLLLGTGLARLVDRPAWVGLVAMLALTPAFDAHLRQGQLHLPVVVLVVLGLWAWQRERDELAGVCWAIAIGLKVHAWPLVVLAAIVGRWRVVAAAVVTLLAGAVVSIGLLGWPLHQAFFAKVAPAAAGGFAVHPWHPAFQSVGHLLRHLFHAHPALNPEVWVDAPVVARAGSALLLAGVVGATLARAASWASLSEADRRRLLGATVLCAIAGGNILSMYHLVWLLPGAVLGIAGLWDAGAQRRAVAVGLLVAAAAWVPVPQVWPSGALVLAAVPRGYALLATWALIMPWQGHWRSRALGGWAVFAGLLVGRALLPAPALPDGHRLDHPTMPLVADDLTWFDGQLWMRGLTRDGWRDLRVDPMTGEATVVEDGPVLVDGREAKAPDGRVFFLSDAGVGVMADRVWVKDD